MALGIALVKGAISNDRAAGPKSLRELRVRVSHQEYFIAIRKASIIAGL